MATTIEIIFKCLFLCLMLKISNANLCNNVKCESSFERCVGNSTHASCICNFGYYRASGNGRCELECQQFYCYHKGTCEQGPNGRVCRCVSPYSGNRCENEKKVVVQIAVGSCVMALVLVIALILILRNNSEKKKKSHPWDKCKQTEETFPIFISELEIEEGRDREDSKPSESTESAKSNTVPGAHHTYMEITDFRAAQNGPQYEVVADVNVNGSQSTENDAGSSTSAEAEEEIHTNVDESCKVKESEDAARENVVVAHAYVNNVAEEDVKEEETNCADEESSL